MTATVIPLTESVARVVVGGTRAQRGANAEFGSWGEKGRIAKKVLDRVEKVIPQIPEPGQTPAPDAVASSAGSHVDALAQLAQLHANGALTDEEFTQAKRKLLE
jgi:hypothetical protein